MNNQIFVFGSNLAGRHGKGAALTAKKYYGAIYGQGLGRQGNSYAIPTKNHNLKSLPLWLIKTFVQDFLDYAVSHPAEKFLVTKIGCGLAGYKEIDMVPMFKDAPNNCQLPEGWRIL